MQNMRDREYDVTHMSCGSAACDYYYCRFCSADCGRVDSIGNSRVYHCQCEAARAHRAQLAERKTIEQSAELMPVAPTLATLARLALRHPDGAVREKARAAIAASGGH